VASGLLHHHLPEAQMMVSFLPYVSSVYMLAATAPDGPPRIDIELTCRTAESEIVKLFGESTVVTLDACLRQENEAHEQMLRNWSSYSFSDKSSCVQARAYMPSYVEWLTCFEMRVHLKTIRENDEAAKSPTEQDR
jgi:hypothetical protein